MKDQALGDAGWAAVVEALPSAVVVVDLECVGVWANRAARQLVGGEDPGRVAALMLDVAPPEPTDPAPTLPAVLGRALTGGAGRHVGVWLGTSLGPVQRDVWVAPLRDETGAVTGALAALTVEEERLQALLEHTADIITVVDADGTLRYSNPAAGRLSGYEGRVMSGTNAFDLIHPDDRERAARLYAEALETPGFAQPEEVRVLHGDGTYRHMVAHVNNLLDHPAVAGVVVTLHDVTDRKRAEEERARSDARLRALVENLTDVIVVINRQGRVAYVSPAIERVLRQPAGESQGGNAFADIHPEDRERVRAVVTELMQQPQGTVRRVELRLRHIPGRDDQWRYIDAIAVNRVDDPDVEGVVATLRDVTDLKMAELRLQEALGHERAAVERLREVDQLKDEFLATVSHELRTPLTVIAGMTRVLSQPGGLTEEQRRELLERVVVNADEMINMVEQLLDYSRLQAGKAEVEPRPIELGPQVQAIVDRLTDRLATHELELDVPDGLVVVADPDAVGHVLRNLLTNAAKFAPAGSRITLRARPAGGEVEVSVIDRGPGIAPEALERIFERFQQGVDVPPSGVRGTGLGLSIARRYTELQGGRIWVESEPGRGATFTFTLPVPTGKESAP